MQKRSVMQKIKKPEIKPTPPPEERKDLDDKDIFTLPKSKSKNEPIEKSEDISVEQDPKDLYQGESVQDTEEVVKPVKKNNRPHLEKARQKSLQVRRQKAEERKLIQGDVTAYKERLEFERLSKKYSKPAVEEEKFYQPPPEKRTSPIPQTVASVNPNHNMSHSMIDYEKLINGVSEKLKLQNDHYAQLEQDIRNDERKRAEATYQDQMKAWEQKQRTDYRKDQAYGALSSSYRRNQVFDRSKKLRETYTERYKNNWYNNY
jgi:hypothetical protein